MTREAIAAMIAALKLILGDQEEAARKTRETIAQVEATYCLDCEVLVSTAVEFQAALDSAPSTDRVRLVNDVQGNFVVRRSGTTIVGNPNMPLRRVPGVLPTADGEFFVPEVPMPTIRGSIRIEPGVSNVYGTGFQLRYGTSSVLLTASRGSSNVTFERIVIDGEDNGRVRRGIRADAANFRLLDSVAVGIHLTGFDSQAILVTDSPGPVTILNSALEAASENIMIGGADPVTPGLVPSDIWIAYNYIFKRPSWRARAGTGINCKNLLELKNARRVRAEYNVLDGSWPDGQGGAAVVHSVRNQDGRAPWSTIEDFTFQFNVVRNSNGGMSGVGQDNVHPSGRGARVTVRHNLFVISGGAFNLLQGWRSYHFEHNTVINPTADRLGRITRGDCRQPDGTLVRCPAFEDFRYVNNLAYNGTTYGLWSEEGGAQCGGCGGKLLPGATVVGNVLGGAPASHRYPAGNLLVPIALFNSNLAGAPEFLLVTPDPYAGVTTDGQPVGRNQ